MALPDDAEVVVVSYPKSGRTWLRCLLGKAIQLHYGLEDVPVFDTYQLTKAVAIRPTAFTHDGSGFPPELHWSRLSSDKSSFRKKHVFFLFRDPHDVLVSSYFHATRRSSSFDGTISQFVTSPRLRIRKIAVFCKQWEEHCNVPRQFTLVRYEDLHDDEKAVTVVLEMLRQMDLNTINRTTVEQAVEFCRFDNLKTVESQSRHRGMRIMQPGNVKDPQSFKMRRGIVGGYVDYLSARDMDYVFAMPAGLWCPFLPLAYLTFGA